MSQRDLARRLITDKDFRARLKADPKAALAEHGISVEADIEVVESTPDKHYFVLPPHVPEEELTEEQLAGISAGTGGLMQSVAYGC